MKIKNSEAMRKNVFILAAAALLFAGCAKEVAEQFETASYNTTISAVIDGVDTKAALADEGTFTWQEGDKIAVYTSAKVFKEFALTDGAGTNKAHFGGNLEAGETVTGPAVYPAVLAPSYVGPTEVKVTLPETYTYEGSQTNVPMTGTLTSGVLAFKQVGGVIKFSVSGIPDDATKLVVSAKAASLTGTYNTKNSAAIVAKEAESSTVTISFTKTGDAMDFYLPVPTGTFSNLGISVRKADDTVISEKVASVNNEITRGKLLLMPAVAVVTEGNIANADQLIEFLTNTSAEDTKEYRIVADIDLSGKTVPVASGFAGLLDGNGHSIKNATLSNAFFATLAETAVVKNLKIANTCSINWTAAIPDETGVAFIASKSSGKILDCEVAGSIKVKSDDAQRIFCAGVVGYSGKGYVKGCKFTGSIDVELTTSSASCSAIAGVAARVGHADMAGKTIVKDCINEGSIKFVFSGATQKMKLFGIGGVVGQTPSVANAPTNHGIIEGCTNKGKIEWQYPAGGKGSYPALGGVAGIVEGQIKACNNYGKLTYTGSKTVAATDASIGGVAGYVTLGASDCHNYGSFNIDAAFAGGTSMNQSGGNTSFSTFGGVFGNAGPYVADNTKTDGAVVVENCSNEADITLSGYMVSSGGPKMCFGGVVGAATAKLKNVVNKKSVTIKTQTKTMYVGGVAGYAAADMESCSNEGSVVLDGDKDNHPTSIGSEQAYFGGVVGYPIKGITMTSCLNKGAVTMQNIFTTNGGLSYIGGVNGSYQGTIAMTDCENSGVVTNNALTPVCLGGISGAFNGVMTNGKSTGKVVNAVDFTSSSEGKESEVGGISGYVNATFVNCESRSIISNAATGAYVGGFVGGGFAAATNEVTWTAINKSEIKGVGVKASVMGRFRKGDKNSGSATVNLGVSEGDAFIIGCLLADLPICALYYYDHKINEINVVKEVFFSENLAEKKFTYDGRTYPVVKLADGKWWMAAPLAYAPAGKTVSSDPVEDAGIWYTYTVLGKNKVKPNVTRTDAYLYDYATAFGLNSPEDITYGTQSDWQTGNYRSFEGTQGICPPGWYIPTRADFLKLVGASNADQTQGEKEAIDDPTALYYENIPSGGSTVKRFNTEGWNFSFMGCRSKTSTTQTGSYNAAAPIDNTKCSEPAWYGLPGLNQIMTSTPYRPNVTGTNVQFFCLMTTFTDKYKEGRLSLGSGNYLHGMEVRCVRKATE